MQSPNDTVLSRVFSLLSAEWVPNFVLDSDPVIDANILTSPTQEQYAIVGENAAIMEDPTSPKTKLCEAYGTIQWLFVPAFNVGTYGAGYMVTRSKSGRNHGVSGGHLNALYRTIRDDSTGDILTICDIPEQNILQIASMRHLSSTMRLRDYSVVRRDEMRKILLREGKPTTEELTKCIHTCVSVQERRLCPVCGLMQCKCKLEVRTARHSCDFNHCSRNLATHCGTFFGTAEMNKFENGKPVLVRRFNTEISTSGGSDAGLTWALKKWAVQRRLKGLPLHPEKPIQTEEKVLYGELDRLLHSNVRLDNTPEITPHHVIDVFGGLGDKSLEEIVDIIAEDTAGELRVEQAREARQMTQPARTTPEPARGQGIVDLQQLYPILAPRGQVPAKSPVEEKGLQRKIQKRIAAQRNDKRRAENLKKLRASLAAIRIRHEELERKRELLTEENKQLRKQLEKGGEKA